MLKGILYKDFNFSVLNKTKWLLHFSYCGCMGIHVINKSQGDSQNSVTVTTDRLSKHHPILKEERSLVVRRKDKPVKRSLVTENFPI